MQKSKIKALIFLSAISAGIVLISNLAAVKLWNFFGIAVDGGIICFPLTYIVGDIIIEFYGQKTAKTVIWSSFILNVIAAAVFWIVIALPSYEGWDMQDAFSSVLGFTPRIIAGSLIAYVASNLLNNCVFTKLKSGKSAFAKSFIARALCSSVFAHLIDSLIFETIAFLGVLPMNEFLIQAGFAYIAGMGLELLLSPIESLIVKQMKKHIEPFKLEVTSKVNHAK